MSVKPIRFFTALFKSFYNLKNKQKNNAENKKMHMSSRFLSQIAAKFMVLAIGRM